MLLTNQINSYMVELNILSYTLQNILFFNKKYIQNVKYNINAFGSFAFFNNLYGYILS